MTDLAKIHRYYEGVHTIVVSDMHLSEAHVAEPKRPYWMAYKRKEFFIDDAFAQFLEWVDHHVAGPVELILNGDIFDFDNILQLPKNSEGKIDWLARFRGLGSEEWMSRFKMERIIADHPTWFSALRTFLLKDHRAIFVIGNHDLDLHWPSVQQMICEALGSVNDAALSTKVTFCNWFYVSQGDTFISHGHQFDTNCAIPDSINPLILVGKHPRIRIPFGNLAGRYMLNGMGYFNPHSSANYIMSGFEYVRFFFRHMLRTQPLLLWTWFWSAIVTLLLSLSEHMHPAMRDPLTIEQKVTDIAKDANVTPAIVRQLSAVTAAPASSRPIAVLRELWLDRGILFLALAFFAWQLILHINIAVHLSPLWVIVPMILLLPPYAIYAKNVKSTVFKEPLLTSETAELVFKITGTKRAVFGHTHEPEQTQAGPMTVLNGGFWSQSFTEPECTHRIGTQTFVWIQPGENERVAAIWEWPIQGNAPILFDTKVSWRNKSTVPPKG